MVSQGGGCIAFGGEDKTRVTGEHLLPGGCFVIAANIDPRRSSVSCHSSYRITTTTTLSLSTS